MIKLTVMIVLAALLIGCGGAQTDEETVDEAAITSAIDALRGEFEAAVAAGDMAALGALVSQETIMVQPGSADWRAMQSQAAGAPFPPGARIEITPIELNIINNEWAYEFGASRITYPVAESADVKELHDTYLLVLRNDGSGWKPFREVASANPPPDGWPQDKE